MQRYFKTTDLDTFELSSDDSYHITKVMRNKIGDNIEVVIDKKLYICEITKISDLVTVKKVQEVECDSELSCYITIAQSLVKEQKMDLILQKLTELGVSSIIPVKTERSIVKIDDSKKDKKHHKWHMICKEASEQSHRVTIPMVNNIMSLKELINNKKDINLICSLNENTKPLDSYLTKDVKSILFVIGPEGGFSQKEEAFLIENGFECTTLGKRVLRVETAAIYVASVINHIYKG